MAPGGDEGLTGRGGDAELVEGKPEMGLKSRTELAAGAEPRS